jgi:hypothetical protein
MGFDRTPTDMIEDRQSGKRLDETMTDIISYIKTKNKNIPYKRTHYLFYDSFAQG